MNKIFKFGLAVFAMLLVSAACFADDLISWKDKRCQGAWVKEDGNGFYFTKGKVYGIYDGKWYEQNYLEIDYSYENQILTSSIYYSIVKIDGNTMVILEDSSEDSQVGFYKKLSKIPPKGD